MLPSLDRPSGIIRMAPVHLLHRQHTFNAVVVHRFEEVINGREYLIEVCPVASERWRAQIVRVPGGPTAMMPFYGPTPDEAARQLSRWLTRAHRHVTNPA
jgi:hypothetical protein